MGYLDNDCNHGAAVTGLLAPLSGVAALAGCATGMGSGPLLGFKSKPISTADTRPRSATVVIRKNDGGVIGS